MATQPMPLLWARTTPAGMPPPIGMAKSKKTSKDFFNDPNESAAADASILFDMQQNLPGIQTKNKVRRAFTNHAIIQVGHNFSQC
ncbi:MAG TPA: hypothetical protein VF412_05525 [Bdellovibrio sp.]|uniref:hypothetical protein n=1 Tax=Bdellovibrio sp. TaxID=28201 RepID=UPI002EE2C056